MNAQFRNRPLPYSSPFANVLVVVVGVMAIVFSLLIGVVAFIALGAAVLVLAAFISIRVWWMGFKSRHQQQQTPGAGTAKTASEISGSLIEGEFQVIATEKKSDKAPRA